MGKCEPKINPSTEKSLLTAVTTEKSKAIATTVEKLLASVSNASEKCMSFNLPNLDDVNDSVTFTAGNLLTGDGTEWVDLALGTASQLLRVNAGGTAIEWATVSGTGDVTGPAVATDEAIVRFDGTSGKIIQDYTGSAPTISNAGVLDMGGNAIDNVSLIDLNVGNAFSINSTDVLSFNTLGAGVVFSTLTTVGTITAGAWESSTDVGVAYGGTGASTAQAAIDTLTAVAGATNEHVLTKDTGTGNAVFKAAAGGGATTALDNLASVAINTTLISDLDITDDLGTGNIRWQDLFTSTVKTGVDTADTVLFQAYNGATWDTWATLRADTVSATSFDLAAGTTIGTNGIVDTTVTTLSSLTSVGTLTGLTMGGTVVMGANNITMTGSLGATGARLTKGWFTDLEVTNAIAGSITGNAATVTTNANLTGEVTSTGNAAAVDPTAISGKGTETPVSTDMLLFWDATDSALKKADAANFLSGSGTVTSSGSPLNNEIAVFATGTDINSDTTFTWDTTTLTVHGTTIDAGGVEIASGDTYTINAVDVLTATALHADVQVPVNSLNGGTLADGTTFWRGDGTWVTPGGSGDVTGDTASADKELVRFNGTGGKTIESPVTDLATTTATLSDNADLTLYDAVNVGNPIFSYGSSATDRLRITPTYNSAAQTLDYVEFATDESDTGADKGEFRFSPDGVLVATIDDGGIELADTMAYFIDTSNVLNETTLGSTVLTSGLTTVGIIGAGTWRGTTIEVNQGGSGQTTYTNGQLLIGNTTGNTLAKATLAEGNGITVTNGTGTITVAADVASTGTPADNYLAHFTDANTVTGTSALRWDDTDLFIRDVANDGNPSIRIGNDSVDELHIETLYHTGNNTLDTVNFIARSSDVTADAGQFQFDVDGNVRFIVDDGGPNTPTGNTYSINGIPVISSSGLGSGISSSSLTTVDTITAGAWESSTDVGVAYGGTGRSAALAYSVVCGGTTDTGAHQSIAALGTSGQVLQSNGAGALPTFEDASGGGNVSNVATPLNDEIAVWTSSTLIEGDANFTWDGPGQVFTASGTTIDAGGVDVATGDTYAINGDDVLTLDTLGSNVLTSSLTTVGTIGAGTWQGTVITDTYLQDTSLTQQGVVELATTAEIETGTDTTRAIPVDQFVASDRNIRFVNIRVIEADTDCAVDTTVGGDFECPFTGTIVQDDTNKSYFCAFSDTAGTTSEMIVDVHVAGTTIMATNKLDIETTHKSTSQATTQPDVSDAPITAGEIITIDIDQIHSGTAAKGLTVRIPIRLT